MSNFNSELRVDGGVDILVLEGHIDEDANLESIPQGNNNEIHIDFQKVVSINSCGIREWIRWLSKVPAGRSIVYFNCPKIIIDQANMVAGFVPEGGKIKSFYVPYYCEETDNEKMVLFSEGKEFNGSEVNPPEDVKDDESGNEMEMDVIEVKYFKFLRG